MIEAVDSLLNRVDKKYTKMGFVKMKTKNNTQALGN